MELWLIRHGETYLANADTYDFEKNTSNPKLTPKGERQAEALAVKCCNVRFDKIISSDLDRAIKTANILAVKKNKSIEIDINFREINMGDLYYRSRWSDYPGLYEEWKKHEADLPYPNGECGEDVWSRCKNSIDIITQYDYERVAIVCHGGTIRSILCGLLGFPQQKRFTFGNPLCNCSISIVTINNNQVAMHIFNDYSHIANIT